MMYVVQCREANNGETLLKGLFETQQAAQIAAEVVCKARNEPSRWVAAGWTYEYVGVLQMELNQFPAVNTEWGWLWYAADHPIQGAPIEEAPQADANTQWWNEELPAMDRAQEPAPPELEVMPAVDEAQWRRQLEGQADLDVGVGAGPVAPQRTMMQVARDAADRRARMLNDVAAIQARVANRFNVQI